MRLPSSPPGTPPAPQPGWLTYWRLTRPGFLSLTAVAVLLGNATAWACGCGFSLGVGVATLALALLAHAAANVMNDHADACNGADAANTQGLFPFTGGSRLIQRGEVTPTQARDWARALLLLVVLGGLWLAVQRGATVLGVGMVGLALAWAYSYPPLQLMSRGLGELTVAVAWWLVVVGADVAQRGQWTLMPAVVGVSLGLLVANILLINGLPDAASDRLVGKRTLATRLGPEGVAGLYAALALAAHAWVVGSVALLIPPATALWGLLSLPLSALAGGLLWRHRREPAALRPAIGLSIASAHVHGLALAVGVVLPRL